MNVAANETHFTVRIVVSSKFEGVKPRQTTPSGVLSPVRFSSLVWKDFKSSSSSVYICIIINSIVMLIAALSAFHRRHETGVSDLDVIEDHVMRIVTGTQTPVPDSGATGIEETKRCSSQVIDTSTLYLDACDIDDSTNILAQCKEQYICSSGDVMVEDHDDSKKTPNQPGSEHRVVERNPPASTELLLNEDMETRVPGSQPDDTENTMDMDAIWMTITGAGKPSHERKVLKESETRETLSGPPSIAAVEQHDREDLMLSAIDWKELRRPNTCNDAVSRRFRDELKRDSSAGLDELNQQVEGFIKKFNEDMLLQREESDRKLLDMIKRGL